MVQTHRTQSSRHRPQWGQSAAGGRKALWLNAAVLALGGNTKVGHMQTKIDPKNVLLMASRPSATNSIKRSVPTYSQTGDRPHKIFKPLTVQFSLWQKTTDVFLLKTSFSPRRSGFRGNKQSSWKQPHPQKKNNPKNNDKQANSSQQLDPNDLWQRHHSEQCWQCFHFVSCCEDGRGINWNGRSKRCRVADGATCDQWFFFLRWQFSAIAWSYV